jgi:hypothetical protein
MLLLLTLQLIFLKNCSLWSKYGVGPETGTVISKVGTGTGTATLLLYCDFFKII